MSNKAVSSKYHVDYSSAISIAKITDVETGETKTERFKAFEGRTAQIIHQDKYTIVIFEDGSKGISMCREGDEFSRKKGLKIAFIRAMLVYLEKQLKQLLKD